MRRRVFAKTVAAIASFLVAPFRATAANQNRLNQAGEKPHLERNSQTPAAGGASDFIAGVPATSEAWGEHLAILTPTRRLGFVIEQLLLCKTVCPRNSFPQIEQLNWEHTQYG